MMMMRIIGTDIMKIGRVIVTGDEVMIMTITIEIAVAAVTGTAVGVMMITEALLTAEVVVGVAHLVEEEDTDRVGAGVMIARDDRGADREDGRNHPTGDGTTVGQDPGVAERDEEVKRTSVNRQRNITKSPVL